MGQPSTAAAEARRLGPGWFQKAGPAGPPGGLHVGVRGRETSQRAPTSGPMAGKPETVLAALGHGGFTMPVYDAVLHPDGDVEWAFRKQGLRSRGEVLAAGEPSGSEWGLWLHVGLRAGLGSPGVMSVPGRQRHQDTMGSKLLQNIQAGPLASPSDPNGLCYLPGHRGREPGEKHDDRVQRIDCFFWWSYRS